MTRWILATALCLGAAACGQSGNDQAAKDGNDATAAGEATAPAGAGGTQTASAAFPSGARIVEENGVTFRVDPDGTRVHLTPADSRIVVDNGVRFRVDPDGNRVRIDERGAAINVDLPDVDVGINEKGNPDVDITNQNAT